MLHCPVNKDFKSGRTVFTIRGNNCPPAVCFLLLKMTQRCLQCCQLMLSHFYSALLFIKRTIAESKKKHEEKQMKAQQLREKLREEKTLKLQKLIERVSLL